MQEHDLNELRQHPDYPGEEAERSDLVGLNSVLRGGTSDAPRVCLNGHIDVVNEGTIPWYRDPWSGSVEGGYVYGRGSVDMKGGVIAALHAIAAVKSAVVEAPGDIVLQAVPSEEDGGAGYLCGAGARLGFRGVHNPRADLVPGLLRPGGIPDLQRHRIGGCRPCGHAP